MSDRKFFENTKAAMSDERLEEFYHQVIEDMAHRTYEYTSLIHDIQLEIKRRAKNLVEGGEK